MAGCKLITYDLRKAGQNYEGVIEKIKSFGTWAKVCESTWIVKTALSSVQVRDALKPQIDANDRLFVATLTGESAWFNTICDSNWLTQNL